MSDKINAATNSDYLGGKFDDAVELIILYSSLDKDSDYESRAMEVLRGLEEAKREYEYLYDYFERSRTPQ